MTNGVITVNEKISTPTVKEFRFPVARVGVTYDVRVTQLTDDTSAQRVSEIQLESFQEVKVDPMTFPGTACLQMVAQAGDQFSSIPTLQGVYKGRIIKVPSNYNATTRVYTGVWDGLYQLAYTNNPAWIFLDFVENTRYGLSRIYPHYCNKSSIYAWAQYCDGAVPNGTGGTRPRWTFNEYVTEPQDAREFSQFIAGAGGARYYDDGNGFVDIIFDDPLDTPVALFINENVEAGIFNYSYTDRQTRANQVVVRFKNKELFYRTDTRIVQDTVDQQDYGIIPDEFVASGCRTVSEALARARLRLITGLTEKEFISFSTNRKGRYLRPWDIILVADADAGYAVSGRIRGLTPGTTFTDVVLDDPFTIEPGISYKLTIDVVDTSGAAPFKTIEYPITTGAGVVTTVRVTGRLDTDGAPELCGYSISSAATIGLPKAYRVLKIDPDDADPDKVTIEAFEINRAKYSYIDGTSAVLADDDTRAYYTGRVDRVTRFRGYITRLGNSRGIRLLWDASDNRYIMHYEIAASKAKGPINVIGQTTDNTFEVEDINLIGHEFHITAVDIRGKRSPSVSIAGFGTGLRYVRPPQNLIMKGGGTVSKARHFSIQWQPPEEDALFSEYVVRVYQPNGTTLKREVAVGTALEWTYNFDQHSLDGLARTVPMKVFARDIFGNESAPVSITMTKAAPVIATRSTFFNGPGKTATINFTVTGDPDYIGTKVYYHKNNTIAQTAGFLIAPRALSTATGRWVITDGAYWILVPYDSFGDGTADAFDEAISYSEPAPVAHNHTANNITTGTFPGQYTFSLAPVIGTGTHSYVAGSLGFSDSNWGFIFRPPRAGAIAAHRWDKFDGTQIMSITEGGRLGLGLASGAQASVRMEIGGVNVNTSGGYPTNRGTVIINEAGNTVIDSVGGLEFKNSVFGVGYGSKILSLDNGVLLFGLRQNSVAWTERFRIDEIGATLQGTLRFPNVTTQKINLWGTEYGIGIQGNTQYYRTASRFSWFLGGVHSDAENTPGAGGSGLMTLNTTALSVEGTGRAQMRRNGDIQAYRSGGTTGYMFFNSAETRYFGFDGANYVVNGAPLFAPSIGTDRITGSLASSYIDLDNFGLGTGIPGWNFDGNDYFFYHRASNYFGFNIAGLQRFLIEAGSVTQRGNTTESQILRVGHGRSGNGDSYLFLVGDTTYSQWGTTLYRDAGGPNTGSWLRHRGTGPLYIETVDAGPLSIRTSSVERLGIAATGAITVGIKLAVAVVPQAGIISVQQSGTGGIAQGGGVPTGVEILGNTGAAMMTFHRPGAFAGYFGIDTDNQFAVGGWSFGNVRYRVLIEGGSFTLANLITTSDERLKRKLRKYQGGLKEILELEPQAYEKQSIGTDGNEWIEEIGFSAQKFQKVLPILVKSTGMSHGEIKDILGLDYAKVTVPLVGAIHDIHELLVEVQERLKKLEEK